MYLYGVYVCDALLCSMKGKYIIINIIDVALVSVATATTAIQCDAVNIAILD